MSEAAIFRWHDGALNALEYCDMTDVSVIVADSWLVDDGRVLALELHRTRFFDGVPELTARRVDLDGFWRASMAMVPATGVWFPRVELQDRSGSPLLVYRHRSAPERTRSVAVITAPGPDVRRVPAVKGPDLERMSRLRVEAQVRGAGEAVILSPDGSIVEGAYSALVWWRGDVLCAPLETLTRIDSVTARSLLTLAAALGIEVSYDASAPSDLEGCEIWALSSLHGIRIVTAWIDGPQPAEQPGRLDLWRRRLGALSRPMDTLAP